MKLREGGYYRRRDGAVLGPVTRNDGNSVYAFSVDSETWTELGLYRADRECNFDLIEEVPTPGSEKPAKRALQVGDRVRAYHGLYTETGQIDQVHSDGTLTIKRDEGGEDLLHRKQCRRLVKRERRRVWVKPGTDEIAWIDVHDWDEFVEVRKK